MAEKKVKIDAPALVKPGPQHTPKASADPPSRSWYTPAKPQPPTTNALQRPTSSTPPRTAPPKTEVWRANPSKVPRNRARVESESRGDGVGPAKRQVPKHLIRHPDCPWVESTNNRTPHNERLGQRRPVRFATRESDESDRTAVEGGARTCADAKVAALPAKPAHDILRPTVRLVSKPLPALPIESVSSKCSASTSSAPSDDGSFSYREVIDMFPKPPKVLLNLDGLDDWESSNSLLTPLAFMSCPNTSSSSIDTIASAVAPEVPVRPLLLKAAPKPKVATVVHQIPRASRSLSQFQESIATQNGRAHPQASMEGGIHTGPASAPRRKSSSFTSSRDVECVERERLERKRKYEVELQKEQELKLFEMEFGYNPLYKGKKSYQRETDPDGFELIEPGNDEQRAWA